MRRRLPELAVVALAVLAATSGAGWATGGADMPAPISSSTTTTTPPTSGGSPTTTTPHTTTTRLGLGGATTTTTTTVPSPGSSSTTTTSTTVPPADSTPTAVTGGVVPDWAQKEIGQFRATPGENNAALVAALQPLTALGLTPTQALMIGSGRFPIAGRASWVDSFLEARFTADGGFRFHHAIDIPADCGTPLRAPDEGVVTEGFDQGGGITAEITEPDGTYMYLAHLVGYAPGLASGQQVHIGDLIGFVGETGDATGCHLHLEIHPQGGEPVDPKPFVDAWYGDALAAAPVLVDALRADRGLPPLTTSSDVIERVFLDLGR